MHKQCDFSELFADDTLHASIESWWVRGEVVRQIASGWKHEPGILELLKQWVLSDKSEDVRTEAVRQIATG